MSALCNLQLGQLDEFEDKVAWYDREKCCSQSKSPFSASATESPQRTSISAPRPGGAKVTDAFCALDHIR